MEAVYQQNRGSYYNLSVDYATGVTSQYGYSFDGLLESITGSDGTRAKLGYDIKGGLSSLTFTENGATIHDAWYSSDNQGRPTKASLFSLGGAGLAYDYDGMGRLAGRSLELPCAVIRSPLSYVEGHSGNVTDLVSQYTNEDAIAGVLQQYGYDYDANGNITGITDANGQAVTYVYDGLNRLVSESDGATTLEYCYDVNGNLTSVVQDSAALHSYAYGNSHWKDQLTAFDGKAITYDALGNPLTYDGRTFSWQRGRQLAGIAGGGQSISYDYNAAGKTVDSVTTAYTYANDTLMRQQTGSDVLDFTYDAGGRAVGFKHNDAPYFYLRNLQNDVAAIVDAEGTIVAEYVYDAWGNATVLEDPEADPETQWLPRFMRAAGFTKTQAAALMPGILAAEIGNKDKLRASMEAYFTGLGTNPPTDPGAWIGNSFTNLKSVLRADSGVGNLLACFSITEIESMLAPLDIMSTLFYRHYAAIAQDLRGYFAAALELDLENACDLYAINAMLKGILRFYLWLMTAGAPDLETDMAQLLGETKLPVDIRKSMPLRRGIFELMGAGVEAKLQEPEIQALLAGVLALDVLDLGPVWDLCETMEWDPGDVEQLLQDMRNPLKDPAAIDEIAVFVLALALASPQAIEAGGPLYVHFAAVLDGILGVVDTIFGGSAPALDLDLGGVTLDADVLLAGVALIVELMILGMDTGELMVVADILQLESDAAPAYWEPDEAPTGPVRAYDPALAELNPIRYRGYYFDNETGYYFLQTRYYDPQWRRFINADSTFIAGDDMLNGSNMYAYCNGNPVMYTDPTGRGRY